jgi:hypothetical protein
MEAVVEQVVIGVWEEHQGSTVDVAEAVAVHQPGQQWPEFQRWWISGDGAGGCCRDQVGQLKGDVARVGGDGRDDTVRFDVLGTVAGYSSSSLGLSPGITGGRLFA